MNKKYITKFYCPTDGWVSANPCLICEKPTTETVLPARRGDLYFLKDLPKPVPSVTSVLKVLDKPALVSWAARKAAESALHNPNQSVEEAVSSIYKTKTAAGRRGGDVHDLVAAGKLDEVPPEYAGYVEAYKKFMLAMPHEIIEAEKIVYSPEYAGRFDRLAKAGEQRWLLDFKTSSGLYDEFGLQLSGYKHAEFIERVPGEGGEPIDLTDVKLMGVQLGQDGTFATKEYPDSYEVFLACLKIYQWRNPIS